MCVDDAVITIVIRRVMSDPEPGPGHYDNYITIEYVSMVLHVLVVLFDSSLCTLLLAASRCCCTVARARLAIGLVVVHSVACCIT